MTKLLPLHDLSTDAGRVGLQRRLDLLREAASAKSKAAAIAAQIIERVRRRGDAALVEEMRKWTDPHFTVDRIRVNEEEINTAEALLDPAMRNTIGKVIEHVQGYQRHIMPSVTPPIEIDGAELGLRFTPVDRVGLTVPGGSAVLFSTLVMLAVPAQVAGVDPQRISVVNPPPYRREGEPARDLSPIVLATGKLLGIKSIYRIGGPAGVAALTYGTESVQAVDMIVGPGHPVVAAAQSQVRGLVGTGDYYGASEIVTIADESARASFVAADLIAQAEHDPGKCFLIAWSAHVIEAVQTEMGRQLEDRRRRDAILRALWEQSAAFLVQDMEQAVSVANQIAPEHLNLAVARPEVMLDQIRHAGEIFLGDQTPVAAGDYWAGPSHTLPTDTTARFASGVSVYTFLKRTSTVRYANGLPEEAVRAIAQLAEAEGLDAHAASVLIRQN